jgi:hypothetical protein
MKKIVYLLVILLCLSLVSAGESYDLDFSGEKTKAMVMNEGDEVRFEMLGGLHSVILDRVSESSVEFDIVPFIGESTNVGSGYVTLDTIAKFDLDKDGIIEMNVALYSVNSEGQATIVFQSLADESDDDEVVDEGVVDQDMPEWKSTVLKVIAVCVVILVVFYIFRGKKEDDDEEKLTVEEEKEVDDLLDKAEKEMTDE